MLFNEVQNVKNVKLKKLTRERSDNMFSFPAAQFLEPGDERQGYGFNTAHICIT